MSTDDRSVMSQKQKPTLAKRGLDDYEDEDELHVNQSSQMEQELEEMKQPRKPRARVWSQAAIAGQWLFCILSKNVETGTNI